MKLIAPLLLSPLLLLGACRASSPPAPQAMDAPLAAGKPVNALCPMSRETVDPAAGCVSYRGATVGFCCPDCVGDFQKLSDSAKTTALAGVGITLPAPSK